MKIPRMQAIGLAPMALMLLMATMNATAATATAVTACGTTLSTPGQYYLANSLSCTTSDGVSIAASGVHFNLNGYTISGPGSGCFFIGIFVQGSSTTALLTDIHV